MAPSFLSSYGMAWRSRSFTIAAEVLGRQVGEHRRHLRRRDAQDDEGEDADQGGGDRAHGGKARRAQRPDEFDEPLHGLCPSHSMDAQASDRSAAPDPASFAGFMVSIWLTAGRGAGSARCDAAARNSRKATTPAQGPASVSRR